MALGDKMKVGDLVKCQTAGGALGIVVQINNQAVGSAVVVILARNNVKRWFQYQHLEVICK